MSERYDVAAAGDLPPLPVGNLRFYDNLQPPLEAGTGYSIVVTQIVSFPNYDKPQPPAADCTFTNTLPFVVEAPQFVLNRVRDVFSVSPANNAAGDFGAQLPHIVLTDAYLPWARPIEPNNSGSYPGTPWVALLLLDEQDTTTVALPTVQSWPLSEILSPAANEDVFRPVLPPPIVPGDSTDSDLRVNAIDIPTSLFLSIVPRLDELPWLAHVREVNPANKEEKLLIGDGRYSTVVGNRFPAGATTGASNGCYLVSLEGFAPYLPTSTGNPAQSIAQPSVRLVVLASWQFQSSTETVGFAQQLDNISVGAFGIAPPPEDPPAVAPPSAAVSSSGLYVGQVLQNGYVPVEYSPSWLGEQTLAWYRGPFAPDLIEEVLPTTYSAVEAAMIYDPATGLFDLSYAAAWQVGRLLALSCRGFGDSLKKVRQQARRLVLVSAQRAHALQSLRARADAGEDLRALARPHLVRELAHRYVAELARQPGVMAGFGTRRQVSRRTSAVDAGAPPLARHVSEV
jgi:hypothetical protein